MNANIPVFSIRELFENRNSYLIPIYQRNYAWGEGQVNQLIQDVFDFAFDEKKNSKNYYIGTLVVNKRLNGNEILYETIDGQQRLTTLNLVLVALHQTFDKIEEKIDYKLNLKFSSREKSTHTLEYICQKNFNGDFLKDIEYNSNIKERYLDAVKALKKVLIDTRSLNIFYKYLTEKVQVVRVSVPEKTDLNHYFEIMNNRGEQLEKHEILKSKMLEIIKDDEDLSNAFSTIWDSCSDMERYVQYGFSVEERNLIFGKENWNDLKCNSLKEVAESLLSSKDHNKKELSLKEIATSNFAFELNTDHVKEAPDRFNSVVNFQNFLLHVLKVQTRAKDASSKKVEEKSVSLDDKRLLDFFEPFLNPKFNEYPLKFVEEFGFNLLKMKHLFDQFILKREFKGDKDEWSLKRLKWYTGNRVNYVNSFGDEEDENILNQELIMLLSMFHVSTPTMVYKYWLNAALLYLFEHSEDAIQPEAYLEYLKNTARKFLFRRFLFKDVEMPYYSIIYGEENNGQFQNCDINWNRLDKGTDVENFVFNYLDYILWRDMDEFKNFKFTFKSSIEHHYPQNPPDNHIRLNESDLHSFGNLSLMSSQKNSRFTNNMPEAKQKNFNIEKASDSIKMQIMFKITENEGWGAQQIIDHREKMKNILLNGYYA
jgi:uncharacterized protein with ParB-like and HNH nuclease domain